MGRPLVDAQLSRRELLRLGVIGAAGSTLRLVQRSSVLPARVATKVPSRLPDIQHDIGDFIAPAETIDGVAFRFGPVFTRFVTARLLRVPTHDDQKALAKQIVILHGGHDTAHDAAEVHQVSSVTVSTIPMIVESTGVSLQPSAMRAELPETAITVSRKPALTVSTDTT